VLGSAQIRVEHGNEVWVVSGDYKRASDPTCAPFEVVPCTAFISEATFALPVYRWQPPAEVARQIYEWWQADLSRPSLLFCYAFGKAQRVLAELMRFTDRPVYLHGAVTRLTQLYRDQGVQMLPTRSLNEADVGSTFAGELIIAPPSAHRSPWMKRFKLPQTAFASGWMAVRGNRRRRGYERGFVLSDHIDWTNLIKTIEETGASRVLLTHGQTDPVARYLREVKGLDAQTLAAPYEGEQEDGSDLEPTSEDVQAASNTSNDTRASTSVAANAKKAPPSPKKGAETSAKISTEKALAKKSSSEKSSAEKTAPKKVSSKKTATKKASAKKTSTKKTSAKQVLTVKAVDKAAASKTKRVTVEDDAT
jgi:putative mRNA 3-end processing factor